MAVSGILGRKLGMTQVFAEDGSVVPVTVLKAGPCVVVQRKTAANDGWHACRQKGGVNCNTAVAICD